MFFFLFPLEHWLIQGLFEIGLCCHPQNYTEDFCFKSIALPVHPLQINTSGKLSRTRTARSICHICVCTKSLIREGAEPVHSSEVIFRLQISHNNIQKKHFTSVDVKACTWATMSWQLVEWNDTDTFCSVPFNVEIHAGLLLADTFHPGTAGRWGRPCAHLSGSSSPRTGPWDPAEGQQCYDSTGCPWSPTARAHTQRWPAEAPWLSIFFMLSHL